MNIPYTMRTKYQTVAGKLKVGGEAKDYFEIPGTDLVIDQLFRVQFYSLNMVDGVYSTVYHNATLCN